MGTNVLSGGRSPYMPIIFMRRHRDFQPMYEWGEDAAPEDAAAWEEAFLHFMRKAGVASRPIGRREPDQTT